MGTFSNTKKRKFSMGNRVAYQYSLTNVQTTGSKLYTPFKKITGYLIETTSPNTSTIAVTANQDRTGSGTQAYLQFIATAESQGSIIVVGLL
jgi:hypothetical protein